MPRPFLVALIFYLLGLTGASAHVVDQLFADFRIDQEKNAWNVIIRIDAGISLPESRADAFAPQPRREWLLALKPNELDAIRKGTEEYLRSCLTFSWLRDGKQIPASFALHFPAWDSTPPHFNEEFSDTGYAYFDCIIHAPIPTEGGTLQMHLSDGNYPDFTIAHEGASVEQFIATVPGSSVDLWKTEGQPLPTRTTAFLSFLHYGYRHVIPEGWDHVLFIAALCCLSFTWRPLLTQSLVFTLAHTLTLAFTVIGIIERPTEQFMIWVEIFIAATIVYVAIENLLAKKMRLHRLFSIFCFGLIHGLGFASVLGDKIQDSGSIAQPLIAANLGVEFGQITVIAIMLISLGWLRHHRHFPIILKSISITIALVGTYWMVSRFTSWYGML